MTNQDNNKHLPLLFLLAFIKGIIQLLGNRNYGFHRDELLHLSASEHLDWGFMEFPPFIALVGKLSYLLFDYSLMGMRLFPTIAGVGILILCGLMANELKGSNNPKKAVLFAGICVLAFLPFYRNHTLFQPVAFDQLFWTLGFYYLIKFLNSENKQFLLLIGLSLGIGILNKYTMLAWAFGVFIGMIFYQNGKVFINKWWYISGFLALLIIAPNILWQFQNNLPILRHLQELNESQLSQASPFEFGLKVLEYPFTLIVSILGLYFLLGRKQYKAIGIAAIIMFVTMWLAQAKAYYIYGLYPVLFAAGSVQLTNYLTTKKPYWLYLSAALLLLPATMSIPFLTPILPINSFVSYAGIEEKADGRVPLTGDYADMFGWEEQVQLVDSVYNSLTKAEQRQTVIWAENYGEAGAIKILGNKYKLPDPISRHGSFWMWGYQNAEADVWISIGNEKASVESVFEEVQLVKMIYHKYAIGEENGIPLYICRKSKVNIKEWWAAYEPYIFD